MKRYKKLIESKATIQNVKKMANSYGYDFFKGKGYFYFSPIDYTNSRTPSFSEEGVYVYKINDLTLEEWEQELLNKIKM